MAFVLTSRLGRLVAPRAAAARGFCYVQKPGQAPVGQKEDWSQDKPKIVLPEKKAADEYPQFFNRLSTMFDWSADHPAAEEQVYIGQRGMMRNNVGPQVGAFGTLEAPTEIMSNFDSRVVGCVGGEGELAHTLRWFNLRKGRLHACHMCGQIFKLTNEPLKDQPLAMPIEDPEGLGRQEFEIYAAPSWANFERMGKYDTERPDVIDIYNDREARRKEAQEGSKQ